MAYDISMTSDIQLLNLINDANGVNIARDQLAFGVPEAAQGATPAGDTQITVSGVHNGGFKSTVTCVYNRIPLQAFFDYDGGPIQVADQYDVDGNLDPQAIVDAFNAYFGSALIIEATATTPSDVDDSVMTDVAQLTWEALVPGTSVDITIQAAAGSIAYLGSATFPMQQLDRAMDSVITTTDLNGLVFTLPA